MFTNLKFSFFSLLVFALLGNDLNAQCNTIDFSASQTSGCAPLPVTFTASNVPSGSKLEWDLGGGFVNGTDTAFRFFTISGKKTIRLRITLSGQSSACTTITKTDIIDVLPKPDINLYISDTLLCAGSAQVRFIDSTLNVAKRTWIFDGNTETSTGTTINKFPAQGDMSVSLLVENSLGCQSVYRNSQAVRVYATREVEICANIIERDTATIANFRGNILTSSVKPDSFNWSFPNAITKRSTDNNPKNIVYTNPVGTNAVTMEVIFPGGCRYSDSKSDYIKPFITINDDSACIRQELEVTNLASDNNRRDFTMSFPGANFIGGDVKDKFQISYVSLGAKDLVYSFKYSTDDEACETSVRADDIVVIEGPQARAFSNDKNLCTLDSLLIQSNSVLPTTGDNIYTWRIFDADSNMIKPTPLGPTKDLSSFKIKFDTFGVYNLSLKVENTKNGCADSTLLANYIRNKPPTAGINFSDTVICADGRVELTDNTDPKPTGGNPYKYQWLLEHSDSSNIQFTSVSRSFRRNLSMPGTYTVRLIVESNNSCKDTLLLQDYIEVRGILAEVSIDSTKGCEGFQTTLRSKINLLFPDTSNPSYIYNWSVSPGGNGEVTIASPSQSTTSITFNDAGCYSTSLQIEDVYGCRKNLDAGSTCIGVEANFGWDDDVLAETCLNEPFALSDSSAFAVSEWQWSVDDHRGLDFVDSTERFARVIFRQAGKYKIKQVVSSGAPAFCKDSIIREIEITAPEANFSVDKPLSQCAPESITFTNSSKNADTYIWNYDDGSGSQNSNTNHVHVYTENNLTGFVPSLIAYKNGVLACADTFDLNSRIRIIGPTPLFSADTLFGCDTTEISFFNLTNPINASYVFDYGDGSAPDSNRIRKHTYSYNSTTNADSVLYFPTIIANSFGCNAFYSDTIVIYKSPNASFVADTFEGCRPLTITLVQKSSVKSDFYWDLWNNNTIDSFGQDTVVWTIDTVGKFGASLYAQNGTCFDQFKVDSAFEVGRAPQAGFSLDVKQGCDSITVNFTNTTNPSSAGFVIDYGDGSKPDTNKMSNHIYIIPAAHPTDSIIYYPTLTATSFGCDNITQDTVVVYRSPSVNISIDTSIGCQPFNAVLSATISNNFGFEWDLFNNGIVDTQNVAIWPITLDTFGYFDIRVSATYIGGCTTTQIVDSIVRVIDLPVPDFTMNVTEGCDSFEVVFRNNTSPSFTTYAFDYGDGTAASNNIANHTYYYGGTEDSIVYYPRIIGTRFLCDAEFSDTVVVYKSPTADFVIDTTFGCEPANFSLLSTSSPYFSLQWDVFNDTLIEKIDNDTLAFLSDSVGIWPVRLFVEYRGGCTSSKVVDSLFTVYRMPEPQLFFDTIRGCDSLSVNFTTNNPSDSFIIEYGNGLSDTNVVQTAKYYFPTSSTTDSAQFLTIYKVYNPLLNACASFKVDTLLTFRSPTVSFLADTTAGCAPFSTLLKSNSPRAAKYFWDFNNDSISDDSLEIVQPIFRSGKQTIGLAIESIEGCRDTLYLKNYLTVYEPPRVDFTISRAISCANDPVQFNDVTQADTLISEREWNFSTPVNSDKLIVPRPQVGFPTTGIYEITLRVTDSNFCTSSDTNTIEIINIDTPTTVNPLLLFNTISAGNQISWNASALGDFENYTLIIVTENDSVSLDLSNTNYSDVNGDVLDLAKYSIQVTDSCSNKSIISPHLSRLVLTGDNALENVLRINWNYLGKNNWTKFRIHRRSPSGTTWSIIDSISAPSVSEFLDSTACDSGYVYRVEGITDYGASSMSNEIALTSQFSKKTSALEMYKVSIVNNDYLRLDFERNQHPGQRKYIIDRAGADLVWQIGYDSAFSNHFIDSNANFNQSYYYYRVYMQDFCGNRNPLSNLGTSIALKGNGSNGNIKLNWNEYIGWPSNYDFVLQVKFGANNFSELARFNQDGTSYIDYELHSELDTPWCYRVMAVRTDGVDSVYSNYYCDYLSDSIFVPNAFTPNNDGVNDYFVIGGDILMREDLGNLQSYDLKILDRWGEILFESTDPKLDWDGTKAGVTVPLGQYWYMLTLVDGEGNESLETGPVFVIK
ncbi:MAG: gliding motility-associated C-terminal domain-containing protein [Bacteroidia bacterium]